MKTTPTKDQIQDVNDMKSVDSISLNWDDVVVYNEMADQTSVRLNLLEHIQSQMSQLEEMSARRQFLTKELMTYFNK